MFIAIPHSTTLQLGGRPYVTWTIMALCLLIHLIAPDSPTLMYFPDTWNPVTMLTASVAHADWEHIIFNLIFFYAFSPMLEMAIASSKRYVLTLLAIAFVTHISYSIFSLITGEYIPTLGLSGVLMGVIGLSAYLIPRARVQTFVWVLTYVRNTLIPAWILAAWFIGWDIWDMYNYGLSAGVNFISHISGGFAGYLIGYFYFREHKKDIREEVDDAIEYARSVRQDTGIASTYSGDRKRLENEARERDAKRNHEQHMSRIYNYVQANRDSDAIILILDDYDLQQHSVEIYDALFNRMLQWGPSKALLCTGRLIIDLHLHNRQYLSAINMAKQCHTIAPEFVLADSLHVLVLAKQAMVVNEYELAWMIIKNVNVRYGNAIDTIRSTLLEVELLWMYLGKPDKARELITNLLAHQQSEEHRAMILSLAKSMQ
jgi:membrane associated rhomboid family serine protease